MERKGKEDDHQSIHGVLNRIHGDLRNRFVGKNQIRHETIEEVWVP